MSSIASELKTTKEEMISLVNSVNGKDTDVVPFKGSWTVGQLLEHVDKAVSPSILYGNLQSVDRPADEKVELIKKIFLDFETKFQSPEFIEPVETVHNKDVQLDSLSQKFDELIHASQTMNMEEEYPGFELPGMGRLTRLEWISFYMVHTQRHMHQLKNIISVLQKK